VFRAAKTPPFNFGVPSIRDSHDGLTEPVRPVAGHPHKGLRNSGSRRVLVGVCRKGGIWNISFVEGEKLFFRTPTFLQPFSAGIGNWLSRLAQVLPVVVRHHVGAAEKE